MGLTIAEKIFSQKVGRPVEPGEYIIAPIDCAMLHEGFAVSWIHFMSSGASGIWDPEKVVVLFDHYIPAPTERLAAAGQTITPARVTIPSGLTAGRPIVPEASPAAAGKTITAARVTIPSGLAAGRPIVPEASPAAAG